MRDIKVFGVDAHVRCAIRLSLKIFLDLGPWCAADVFEKDERGTMICDPRHHPAERTPGFAFSLDVLLLIIQIRVVDAGSARDEDVDVARNFDT